MPGLSPFSTQFMEMSINCKTSWSLPWKTVGVLNSGCTIVSTVGELLVFTMVFNYMENAGCTIVSTVYCFFWLIVLFLLVEHGSFAVLLLTLLAPNFREKTKKNTSLSMTLGRSMGPHQMIHQSCCWLPIVPTSSLDCICARIRSCRRVNFHNVGPPVDS